MFIDCKKIENVFLVCGYTDLRKGIDGLVGIITNQFELNLFDFDDASFHLAETTAEQNVEMEKVICRRAKKSKRREMIIKELPIIEHIPDLSESEKTCDCCGNDLSHMEKKEVESEVVLIPASLEKHIHCATSYECSVRK